MTARRTGNRTPPTEARRQGVALVLVTMFLFAAYDATAKFLAPHYPAPEILWVRYCTHVALMLLLFWRSMGLKLLKTRRPVLQCLRALMLVAVSYLIMNGLRTIPLAETTAIVFLTPLLVAALSSPMLKEKTSPAQWMAVLLGFIGVLVIVRPGGVSLNPAILFPLCSAVCFALYQILTRKFSGTENPVTTHFYTGLVGMAVSSVAWQPGWTLPTLGAGGLMMALGVFSGVGHYLLIKAFLHMGPAAAAPYSYTQLAWAVLFGFLCFGDIPDGMTLTGILIIAASGLYVVMRPPNA